MAEYTICPNCERLINLEIDIIRDNEGKIYCSKCGKEIKLTD